MTLFLLALLSSPVRAQDASAPLAIPSGAPVPTAAPASADEQPLAIPPDQVPPSLAVPGPRRHPGLSPDKLAALRQYQAERLQIHGETELHGGGTTVWAGGWWGPRWGPVTTVAIAQEPIFATRSWGFYQGPQRLDVPDALQLAGDPRAPELQARIDHKRAAARGWRTVAGAGGVALVTSIFGNATASNLAEHQTWGTVGLAGGAVAVVGLIAGSSPAAEAATLARYPAHTLSPAEARAVVDAYNDHLRDRLGLSPQDVWSIEQAPPPPQGF